MAEAVAGNLVVNVLANVDKFTQNINKVRDQLQSAGTKITAFGVVAATGFGFAIKAAADQEHATVKLVAVLKNYGHATQDNIKELTEHASALQKLTAVADDVITDNQALLASFGMNTAQIKEATLASLNLAAVKKIDLNTAALLVGKAFAGETGSLSRYGIVIKEGITKSEKFSEVLKILNGTFAGAAAAHRNTFLGQIDAIKTSFGDLAEDIGFVLLPYMQRMAKHLENFIEKIRKVNPDILKMSVGIGAVATGLALIVGPTLILVSKLPAIVAETKVLMNLLLYGKGLANISVALGLIITAVTMWITKWDELKISSQILLNFMIGMLNDVIKTINQYLIPPINQVLSILRMGKIETIAELEEIKIKIADTSQISKDKLIVDSSETANAYKIDREAETSKHLEEWDKRIIDAQKGHEYLKTFSQELRFKLEEDSVSWTTIFVDSIMQLKDAFASGIADLITEGGKFADTMEAIGKRILNFFIEEVIKKMVTNFILGQQTMAESQGLFQSGMGTATSLLGGIKNLGTGLLNAATNPLALVGLGVGVVAKNLGGIGRAATKVGKKIKKVFSGGILGEPSIITGLRTGAQAIAGEDGPEALVSFRDDMGITPREARRRLSGFSPRPGLAMAGGGGESITVNIYGQFLEADNAKWDKLVREKIVLPLQRYRKKTTNSLI